MPELIERFLNGERRALARVITRVEAGSAEGRELVQQLYSRTEAAHTVGITGSAGSGKSTLTSALAKELRKREKTIGIIAVDPSSPFTQGAILGDRIRMQDLALDPGVYVRSMAGRGALGGLAPAINDVVAVVAAFGFDYVLIETVGAGQDEVEIAGTALTTILVNNPGTGDDIQAMKAGILEIADILVVNKADLPGADTLASQLRGLLSLAPAGERRPPILKTIASRDEGMVELAEAVDEHRQFLRESNLERGRMQKNARHQLLSAAQATLLEEIRVRTEGGDLESLIARIADRELDPHTAAEELIASLKLG